MLCCGVLTLFAALLIGFARWLRTIPKSVRTAGGAVLLVVPVLALAGATAPEPANRAEADPPATHAWCGRPLE